MTDLYLTDIAHFRSTPVRHTFSHRSCSWLVDLDALGDARRPADVPRWLAPLVSFHAADHLGRPDRTWRDNLGQFVAHQGIDLSGGRVTALTSGRTLGHIFNPLTLYWCHDRQGALACVVAEVHNTYGQRHAYLLHPNDRGSATVDKEFYVSPFNDIDGHYRMTVPEPADDLAVIVTLHRTGERPFVATWRGHRVRSATDRLRATARLPLSTWLVSGRIRWQGLKLWRRLPIVARPAHHPQEGV